MATVCPIISSKYQAISVGRVMTCVLGMVVRREREIRVFVKTPFYRVLAVLRWKEKTLTENGELWKAAGIFSPRIFIRKTVSRKREHAEDADRSCSQCVNQPFPVAVEKVERRKRKQKSAAFV